ncbi:MAG: hypothetical protein MN733_43505, partial [Nitrososphaera sp.]|nr:hypothetical protein [Nitrososphaera sp.]
LAPLLQGIGTSVPIAGPRVALAADVTAAFSRSLATRVPGTFADAGVEEALLEPLFGSVTVGLAARAAGIPVTHPVVQSLYEMYGGGVFGIGLATTTYQAGQQTRLSSGASFTPTRDVTLLQGTNLFQLHAQDPTLLGTSLQVEHQGVRYNSLANGGYVAGVPDRFITHYNAQGNLIRYQNFETGSNIFTPPQGYTHIPTQTNLFGGSDLVAYRIAGTNWEIRNIDGVRTAVNTVTGNRQWQDQRVLTGGPFSSPVNLAVTMEETPNGVQFAHYTVNAAAQIERVLAPSIANVEARTDIARRLIAAPESAPSIFSASQFTVPPQIQSQAVDLARTFRPLHEGQFLVDLNSGLHFQRINGTVTPVFEGNRFSLGVMPVVVRGGQVFPDANQIYDAADHIIQRPHQQELFAQTAHVVGTRVGPHGHIFNEGLIRGALDVNNDGLGENLLINRGFDANLTRFISNITARTAELDQANAVFEAVRNQVPTSPAYDAYLAGQVNRSGQSYTVTQGAYGQQVLRLGDA